jgi:hypothetical protein
MSRFRSEPPKVEGFKLSSIFSDHSPLVIPRWQREFTWRADEQVDRLITDLYEFFETNQEKQNKGYYLLGQVILVPNESGQYEVVDGQQRLTTIFILLIAILNKYRPYLDENTKTRVFTLIEEVVTDQDEKVRLKSPFQGGTEVLQALYDQRSALIESVGPLSRTQRNLKEVYEVLEDWISDNLNSEELISEFARLLLQNIYFSRLLIDDIPVALDYFEKMNRRGVPLAAADLLKNFLFAQLQDSDEEFDKLTVQWQGLMNELNNVKRSSIASPESFIKAIALSESGTKINGSEPLLKFWKDKLSDGDRTHNKVTEFRNAIESLGKFYSRAARGLHPKAETPIVFSKIMYRDFEPIEYLKGSQHLPVLFAAQHLDEFDYVCDLLNRRFVIYAFARERTGSFESMIPVWSRALRELSRGASREEILEKSRLADGFLVSGCKDLISNFVSTLNYAKTSQHKKMRFVLAVVSKYFDVIANTGDSSEPLNRYLRTVSRGVPGIDMDHILGQQYLDEFSETEKSIFNSIGALTLVFSSDHREQTLLSPSQKVSMYSESRYVFTKSLAPLSDSWAPRVQRVTSEIHQTLPPSLENWTPIFVKDRTNYIVNKFVEALELDQLM